MAGLNYGWRCFEGSEPYNPDGCSLVEMYTQPFAEYTHDDTDGCSITGGYVYTGSTYPNLVGKYIFADYCNNKIGWADADGTLTYTEAFDGNNFTVFGEDINGELYIGGANSGTIYKITDSTLSTDTASNRTFSMHPNPANGQLFLNLNTATATANATIYDITGKMLMQQPLTANENRVDIAALQSGIYMVEVNAGGSKKTQKLVVQ